MSFPNKTDIETYASKLTSADATERYDAMQGITKCGDDYLVVLLICYGAAAYDSAISSNGLVVNNSSSSVRARRAATQARKDAGTASPLFGTSMSDAKADEVPMLDLRLKKDLKLSEKFIKELLNAILSYDPPHLNKKVIDGAQNAAIIFANQHQIRFTPLRGLYNAIRENLPKFQEERGRVKKIECVTVPTTNLDPK